MKPLLDRIDRRTVKGDGADACWVWQSAKTGKNVPVIWHDGKAPPVRRLLWEMLHGPIPKGRAAAAGCGTQLCVRPDHLRLVLFKSDPVDRFWSHVDRSGGAEACWPWKDAASFRNGYGMFRIGWKKPIVQASRHSYEITHGVTLATEQFVMHKCDNPPCCNPAHLELGDAQANNADMWAKGRGSRGPSHAKACAAARKKTGTADT